VLSKDMWAVYYLAAHTWKQKSCIVCTKNVGEVVLTVMTTTMMMMIIVIIIIIQFLFINVLC